MPYLVFYIPLYYDQTSSVLCTLDPNNFFQMVSKQYLEEYVHTDNLCVSLL